MQTGVTQAPAAVGRGLCKERGHRCRPNTCGNTCKPSHFFPLTISTLPPPSPQPHFPQRSFSSLDFFLPLFFSCLPLPLPPLSLFPSPFYSPFLSPTHTPLFFPLPSPTPSQLFFPPFPPSSFIFSPSSPHTSSAQYQHNVGPAPG